MPPTLTPAPQREKKLTRVAAASEPWRITLPEPSLLVVCGLPGSGKTTLLGRVLDPERKVFSAESALIEKLGPDIDWSDAPWALGIREAMSAAINEITARRSTVVETVGLHERIRRSVVDEAVNSGVPAHLIWLSVTPETAREGQRRRRLLLPDDVWNDYVARYEDFIANSLRDAEPLLVDEGWSSVTIIDRESSELLSEVSFSAEE